MKRDETYVHVAIRTFLKKEGWLLIAGQYPGGSDDELHVFNIFDPVLAKDSSPDHRRHSFGKLVPDLIAYKNGMLLVVEAKPEYSVSDKEKLEYLLKERREDFLAHLTKYAEERGFSEILPLSERKIIPTLAFLTESFTLDKDTPSLVVEDLETVRFENVSQYGI